MKNSNFLTMDDLKAVLVGATGGFAMFLIVAPLIVLKMGPFNLSPPAVFLAAIGWNIHPLPWIIHFLYSMFWSVVFVRLFGPRAGVNLALCLTVVIWMIMMVVFSPIMGWGFFGFGNAHLLPPDHPMYLAEGMGYAGVTLLLHVVYGVILGTLNPLWNRVDTL